jgi:hypothetical protein
MNEGFFCGFPFLFSFVVVGGGQEEGALSVYKALDPVVCG